MYVYISVRPSPSSTAYDGWHGTLEKATSFAVIVTLLHCIPFHRSS